MKWRCIEGLGREHYVSSIDERGSLVAELGRDPGTMKWTLSIHGFDTMVHAYQNSVTLWEGKCSMRDALNHLIPDVERFFRDQLCELHFAEIEQ